MDEKWGCLGTGGAKASGRSGGGFPKTRRLPGRWVALAVGMALAAGAPAQTILIEDFETPRLTQPSRNFSADARIGAFTVMDEGPPVTLMRFEDRPGTNGVQALTFGRVGDGGGETGIRSLLTGLQPGGRYVVSLDHSSLALPSDEGGWFLAVKLEIDGGTVTLDRRSGTHAYVPGGDNGYGTPGHPWMSWTIEFTAPSAEVMLGIIGSAGIGSRTGAYPVIDNVRVAAVPEPAVVMLLGPAVGLLAMRDRRQRAERRKMGKSG